MKGRSSPSSQEFAQLWANKNGLLVALPPPTPQHLHPGTEPLTLNDKGAATPLDPAKALPMSPVNSFLIAWVCSEFLDLKTTLPATHHL